MSRQPVGIIKNFQRNVEGDANNRCAICARSQTLREYTDLELGTAVRQAWLMKLDGVRSTVNTFCPDLEFTPILTTDEVVVRPEDASAVVGPDGQLTYPDPFQASYLTREQIQVGDTVPAYRRAIYKEDAIYVLLCYRCYRFMREWLYHLEMPSLSQAAYRRRQIERAYVKMALNILPATDRRLYTDRRSGTDRRIANAHTNPELLAEYLRQMAANEPHITPSEDEQRLRDDKESFGF